MRLVITIDLDNRHQQKAYALENEVRELILAFNYRVGTEADMKPMCLFGDDAEVLVGHYGSRVEGKRLRGPMSSRRRP